MHLTDFIEKNCAAFGLLKLSCLSALFRPSEGTFFIAKSLRTKTITSDPITWPDSL